MLARLNSSDAARRARARAHAAAADPHDRARVLVDRLRAGTLSLEAVQAAARLGSPEARAVLGLTASAPGELLNEFVGADDIAALGDLRLVVSYLADCVEHDLPFFERVSRRDRRPRRAVEFVRAWIATGKIPGRDPLRRIEAVANAAELAGHSVAMDAADAAYDAQHLVEILQLAVDEDPDAVLVAAEAGAETYCLQSADPYVRDRMIEYVLGYAP